MLPILPSTRRVPALASKGRRLFHASIPFAIAGLVAACAAPGPPSRWTSWSEPAPPPPILDAVRVSELRGTATLQDAGHRVALEPEADVGENQPVQVGPKSSLRLSLGSRALLELGPNSRLVVHQLPRDGAGVERATWLRLEQGYLRVVWSDDRANAPIEVSFSRWAAKLEPGEYFFDSRENAASACASGGAVLHLSGVPEWTPQNLAEPCVTLAARKAPLAIALRDEDWATLRSKRRLQPTLAKAAQWQASHDVAGLERDSTKRSTRAVSQARPVAFSDSPSMNPVAGLSRADLDPGARTIAYLPPAPEFAEIPMPEYAAPAPAPAVVLYVTPPESSPHSQNADPGSSGEVFESQAPPAAAAAPEIGSPPSGDTTLTTLSEPDPAAAHPGDDEVPAPAEVYAPAPVDTAMTGSAPRAAAEPVQTPAPAEASVVALAPSPGPATTTHDDIVGAAVPKATIDKGSLKLSTQLRTELPAAAMATQPAPAPVEVAAHAPGAAAAAADDGIPQNATIELPIEPPAPERAEWIVNVASYPEIELAQQHAQQLVAQNYAASLRQETVRGRSSYRVVIEGLPTEVAAQSAVSELESRFGLRTAWVLRKR